MSVLPGTYFAKNKRIVGDRITYDYDLVLDGHIVGTVKTRAVAQRWWKRATVQRDATTDRAEAAFVANRRRARDGHDTYCNQMPRARGYRT